MGAESLYRFPAHMESLVSMVEHLQSAAKGTDATTVLRAETAPLAVLAALTSMRSRPGLQPLPAAASSSRQRVNKRARKGRGAGVRG